MKNVKILYTMIYAHKNENIRHQLLFTRNNCTLVCCIFTTFVYRHLLWSLDYRTLRLDIELSETSHHWQGKMEGEVGCLSFRAALLYHWRPLDLLPQGSLFYPFWDPVHKKEPIKNWAWIEGPMSETGQANGNIIWGLYHNVPHWTNHFIMYTCQLT